MNNKTWIAVAAACAVMTCMPASAATNSTERMASIAQLPDWTGIWRVSGSYANLSGSNKNLPPYNTEWQARLKAAKQNKTPDTTERFCAVAMPRLLGAAQPFEIIVTPEETLVYYSSREVRHIWTDGRNPPPEDERWPMYWAESTGQWIGQMLVVSTINIKGDLWIDPTGATLSDNAQVSERISMVDKNHLKNEITITDATAFTRPWAYTRTYARQPDKMLSEQNCEWQAGKAAK